MNYSNLVELASDRLEHLVDQAVAHHNAGNELNKQICMAEASELAKALDGDDVSDEVFYMIYHRYESESWGVEFEIAHGDEELMFGGV